MADDDIKFDFEAAIDNSNALPSTAGQDHKAPPLPPGAAIGQSVASYEKNYRRTVCTYWLKGLCMKGDTCGFLHEYDADRMPVCRTFVRTGACNEPDCPFKHSIEEIKECNMYKLGFCIYGPLCRYRHPRLQGPPPQPDAIEAARPKEFRNTPLDDGGAGPQRRRRVGPRSGPNQFRDGGQQQQHLRIGGGGGRGSMVQHNGGAAGAGSRRPHAGSQQQQQQQAALPNSDMLAAVGQLNLPYGF